MNIIKWIPLAAATLLAGCMTIDNVSQASDQKLMDVCISPGSYTQDTINQARWELERRNIDCRQIALQTLMMRQGMAAPAPIQAPYPIQTQPAAQAPAQRGLYGTLISSTPTTTVSGQAGYVCEYRVGAQTVRSIQAAAQGPCAPGRYFE